MTAARDLGSLLEAFMNQVSNPKGQALALLSQAAVTVPQIILMRAALDKIDSTPSDLAAAAGISLSSASQMIARLIRLGFLERRDDADDRRDRTIGVTSKTRAFLDQLKIVRAQELAEGTAALSEATRDILAAALGQALNEFERMRT